MMKTRMVPKRRTKKTTCKERHGIGRGGGGGEEEDEEEEDEEEKKNEMTEQDEMENTIDDSTMNTDDVDAGQKTKYQRE